MPRPGWTTALIILLLLPAAQAQEDAPPPPALKQLEGADAQRVEELSTTMDRLRSAGKFDEAGAPAREVLAISERALGPDHWKTADARLRIDTLRRIAGLPETARRELASVSEKAAKRRELLARAQYAEAERIGRDLVAIHERLLGTDHPSTATWYTNLAESLYAQRKYADAEPLFQKALAIDLKTRPADHPDTAASHSNVATILFARNRFAEAEPHHRKALAIALKVWGPDHPSIVTVYINAAENSYVLGHYADAESLFRKVLAIRLKSLPADHLDTASSYNNYADSLNAQGKSAAAEPHYRTALAIRLKALEANHPEIATSYNNLARNLDAQGKHVEARPLHLKAQAIWLKALPPDHPHIALTFNNLAANLYAQGKYAEAEPLYQKALAIRIKALGVDHNETATSYGNLAANLHVQGKHAEAEPLLRKALAITLKVWGPDHPDTAAAYGNLASNLYIRNKHDAAEPLYRKALEYSLKALGPEHPVTSAAYGNLAANLHAQGKHAEAEPLFQKVLEITLKKPNRDHDDTAVGYTNLAGNLYAQGKYAEAEPLYQQALAIRLKVWDAAHPHTAQSYDNLAMCLYALNRPDAAIENWKIAAASSEAGRSARGPTGLERALAGGHGRAPLVLALARQGRYAEAWSHWEADLARGLLDDLSARELRPLTAEQRLQENDLRGRIQKADESIGRLEMKTNRTKEDDQQLETLRQDRNTLRGRFVELENALAEQYRAFAGAPARFDEVRAALNADTALIGWVDLDPGGPPDRDRSPFHWACVVRRDGEPIWTQTPGTGPEHAWTKEDDQRPEALRAALRDARPTWRDPAVVLARQRLEPLKPHLKGIKNLVVLPAPALAGIPIEVLDVAWPDRPAELTIRYAPSGSMFARSLQPRNHAESPPPRLLALGDPAYPLPQPETPRPTPPDHGIAIVQVVANGNADLSGIKAGDVLLEYNGTTLKSAADYKTVPAEQTIRRIPVKIWRDGEIRTLDVASGRLGFQYNPARTAADVVLASRGSADAIKLVTRGASWERLPGTRREVEAITALFSEGQATTLLGERATERALQELAASGQLRGFRFIHLAAHGKSNANVAMSSALHLAPDPDPNPNSNSDAATALESDGRITAQQILNTWDIDADLVVLSACETGLGRHAGGEGYLGFSQALFVKGARAVVLSHWKVPDNATTLLMTRFYSNLLGRGPNPAGPMPMPMSKAEALREAGEWLRGLTVEQARAELKRLGLDPNAATRGRERTIPATAESARPFEHPHNWAGFVLIGDPR